MGMEHGYHRVGGSILQSVQTHRSTAPSRRLVMTPKSISSCQRQCNAHSCPAMGPGQGHSIQELHI